MAASGTDIKVKHFTVPSGNGTSMLHTVMWGDSNSEPKAVLQIIHGMCEYIERYDDFARYMAGHGFVVFGHDHVGHGKTAKSDIELGFFAEKDGWKLLVDDSYRVTEEIKRNYPDLPIFVLGHSMGSFVLENYLAKYGDKISGALVSGTGGSNPLGGVGIGLTKVMQKFKGSHYRSRFVDNMGFGSFCKNIENPRTAKDWLTHDTAIVDKYCADPMCMYLFTLSGYRDLFLLLKNATRKGWENEVPKQLPVIYFAGIEDPVGNYGKGVTEMYDRLKASGQKDISIKLYNGMRHETLNEVGHEAVYEDLLNWIEKRV